MTYTSDEVAELRRLLELAEIALDVNEDEIARLTVELDAARSEAGFLLCIDRPTPDERHVCPCDDGPRALDEEPEWCPLHDGPEQDLDVWGDPR